MKHNLTEINNNNNKFYANVVRETISILKTKGISRGDLAERTLKLFPDMKTLAAWNYLLNATNLQRNKFPYYMFNKFVKVAKSYGIIINVKHERLAVRATSYSINEKGV